MKNLYRKIIQNLAQIAPSAEFYRHGNASLWF